MHNLSKLIGLLLLSLVWGKLLSQPWIEPPYLPIKTSAQISKPVNFYTIQQAFQLYEKEFDQKEHPAKPYVEDEDGKFQGNNQFKRWECFNEQRVYPSGDFPSVEPNNKNFKLEQGNLFFEDGRSLQKNIEKLACSSYVPGEHGII